MLILYIICAILFLLCIIKKDSKVLFYITFSFLWILMAFNYSNADYNMYKNLYTLYGNSQELISTEILFQLVCKIFNYFNISYKTFVVIYSTITIILLASSFKKLTQNCNLVVGLYMIFPFLLDAVQIRHFMAIAFVLFGIRYLITDKKSDVWKYTLCNIIAIGFHYVAAFCLLFIIVKFFENKKVLLFCIIIDLILIVLILSGLGVKILGYLLPYDKVQAYFITNEYKPSNFIILLAMIIQILTVLYAYIVYSFWKKRYNNKIYEKEENNNIEKDKKIVNLILKINNLSLLLIPTFLFNIQLFRISRTILILDYVLLAITLGRKNRKDDIFLLGFTFIIMLLFFYLRIIQNDIFDITGGALLNNNYLIEKIFVH